MVQPRTRTWHHKHSFQKRNQNWKLHKEEFRNLCLMLLGRLNQPHWDGRTFSMHDSPKHPREDTTCRIWVQIGRRRPVDTVGLQNRPCGRHKGKQGERRYNGTLLDGRDIDKKSQLHAPAVLTPGKKSSASNPPSRNLTPDYPAHSLVTILTMLSRLLNLKWKGTDMKEGPVGAFCAHGDAHSGFMKFDVFLNRWITSRLFKKNSAPWSFSQKITDTCSVQHLCKFTRTPKWNALKCFQFLYCVLLWYETLQSDRRVQTFRRSILPLEKRTGRNDGTYQTAWCHNLEEHTMNLHSCENLGLVLCTVPDYLTKLC